MSRTKQYVKKSLNKHFLQAKNQSLSDISARTKINTLWDFLPEEPSVKLENFAKYTSRVANSRYLARYELFKMQLGIHGSIIEIGVNRGASLFSWAQFSAILEPSNYQRKIFGFDSFTGFPSLAVQDANGSGDFLQVGDFNPGTATLQELEFSAEVFDENRFLNHIPKVSLIEGDICKTLPKFLETNPHLLVSLLHCDADLYEPTKMALDCILPRMSKGAVIVFDELNMDLFPGETLAYLNSALCNKGKLQRLHFVPNIAFVVLE